jgi:UV excision repair protein RAD23
MEVSPTDRIEAIKLRLATDHDLDAGKLGLLYKGRQLQDTATVQDYGIDGSAFVVIYQAPRPMCAAPARPPVLRLPDPLPLPSPVPEPVVHHEIRNSPLPALVNYAAANDPPNFSELVEQLVSLGFELPDCEEALRAGLYRMDVAVEYLLAGWAPDPPSARPQCAPIDPESITDPQMTEIYRVLKELKGSNIDRFAEYLKKNHPLEYGVFSQSPAGFLGTFGFTPSDFVLAPAPSIETGTLYDKLVGRFTAEQREVIRRLEAKGFDSMTVLQVYEACDCDENSTEECLRALVG